MTKSTGFRFIDYHGLLQKLASMIPHLKDGTIKSIIYGSEDRNENHRRLLLRWINTPGGPQFAIHQINPLGQTSSGCYYGQDEALFLRGAQWFLQDTHKRPSNSTILKLQDQYFADRIFTFYAN